MSGPPGALAWHPRRWFRTDLKLFAAVASGLVPAAALVWVALQSPGSHLALAGACGLLALWLLGAAGYVRGTLLRHVRTLSNLVDAARMQDHSLRASLAREPGELGRLYQQVNALNESASAQRHARLEMAGLLDRVLGEINVAIVVFDSQDRIRLANRLACALLGRNCDALVGVPRTETPLSRLPLAASPQLVDLDFGGVSGRWQVVCHNYRDQGAVGRLLFVADLKDVLIDEQIAAWRNLSRIVSHEVNNSLTPIVSLCQTLAGLVARRDEAVASDVIEGLGVIGERARGLQAFISVYTRQAHLPEPQKVALEAPVLAQRLQHIFAGTGLCVEPFPPVRVLGDPVHLEQALINLVKNGLDANPPDAAPVRVGCRVVDDHCEFTIRDNGRGIVNAENLFVPFYTTKTSGSGVGLALCRQIAAKHHGHVSLVDRSDAPGALATLAIPLAGAAAA